METVKEGENRRKLLKLVHGEEEDRISALPDCLILEILSLLPSTKDAIRTGALSKRWKPLWPWVTTLVFTHTVNLSNQFPKNPNSSSDFCSFVDKTLNQCRQSKLKKFLVDARYDPRSEAQFNSWIRYAISRNVEELRLTFWNTGGFGGTVLLDQCFTHLTLRRCILKPTGAISWKNLRNLCLSNVRLDEDLIKNILSGSPQLETLLLENCCGYKQLNISSKSVKNLVLSGYSDPECFFSEDIVEINAPNILSLTMVNILLLRRILLVNVSSLVEAYLIYERYGRMDETEDETEEEMLKGFILNLRHVKELKLGGCCSMVLSRLKSKGFKCPSNIK